MGGLRGLRHHLQTTAVQGSPDVLTAVTGQWMSGATRHIDRGHPFMLHFDDLELGTAVRTDSRTVTLDDIEGFAHSTGDHFYAHMDEEAATASPILPDGEPDGGERGGGHGGGGEGGLNTQLLPFHLQ